MTWSETIVSAKTTRPADKIHCFGVEEVWGNA